MVRTSLAATLLIFSTSIPALAASPSSTPTPSTAGVRTSNKSISMKCQMGKTVKMVVGNNPKCPKGYKQIA